MWTKLPFSAVLLMACAVPSFAQEILVDVSDEDGEPGVANFIAPYAFASETYDLGVGVFASTTGRFQDQLTLFGSAFATTNETYNLFLGVRDYRVPGSKRTFLDSFLLLGDNSNLPAYVDPISGVGGGTSGKNDSDPDDLVRGAALAGWFRLPVNYLLPVGDGVNATHRYMLDRGILVDGSTYQGVWNPLKSGRTTLGTEFFWRRQEFEEAELPEQLSTNGLAFSLEYDNTDFKRNPAAGSRQAATLRNDFGWLNSTDTWTSVEFETSHYWSFKPTKNQRQRSIALSAWTADTPSWEQTADGAEHRPPYFEGATLGGLQRMRGYPSYRFNDRSAIYYSLEYRVIPSWHPLGRVRELRSLELDWWQWTAFVEVGRVADSWDHAELHRDMKWDVGLSLRIMAHKQVVRIELVGGPEGVGILFDIGQPF